MRFGVLGPLSVTESGRDVPITAGRDRIVLAMLLLNRGHIVGPRELIEAVWEEAPPATARGQLQTCVSRLRRTLSPGAIQTRPEGYGIEVADDDVDLAEFTHLVASARRATDAEAAGRGLRRAMDLWRGNALAGIDSRPVRQAAAVLDEQYAMAVEDWIDLELNSGGDREVLADLTGLVERFPLRERLRAQLMLALYRAGRQADALGEYLLARNLLRDELGVEPSAALRDMHRRLLTADIDMPVTRAAAAQMAPAAPVEPVAPVNGLPRAIGDFTGRAEVVDRILRSAETAGTEPCLEVIDGMAGSGKTTVAVHVAGRLRIRFPDAQLYIDLQGHSEKGPVEPAAALVTLLRQLGVEADRIPDDLDERIRLWRDALAHRRTLVILDNAASTAQVTPLLPASGPVLTIVTSRRRLVGLDGVRPRSLEVLSEDDAIALLAAIVGDRVAAEPAAAAEVVRRCGRLPLAIRLAGARLAHRQRWQVADLARRLSEAALPELAAEDRTVVSAFALSYGQLPNRTRHVFQLLGVHPAERFAALSVAALADLSLEDARDLLDDLVDVHLVEEPEPGRYRMHDLVREYAGTLAGSLPPDEREEALERLFDFLLHTSAVLARRRENGVADEDFPGEPPKRADLVERAVGDPRWFELLRPELLNFMRAAVSVGEHRRAWQLARSCWQFLFFAGYSDDLIAVMRSGLAAAQAAADERGVAVMNNYLASGYYRVGSYPEAHRSLTAVLDHYIRTDDRLGQARVLSNLGAVLLRLGRYDEARAAAGRSYEIYRDLDHLSGLTLRLVDLTMHLMLAGRHEDALRSGRLALQCAVEDRRTFSTGVALMSVGQARLRLGAAGPAKALLTAALRLTRQAGYRAQLAEITNELGRVAAVQGRYADAVDHHLSARQIMHELGDRRGVAYISNDLGNVLLAMGDPIGALAVHRHALELARLVHHRYEQGRALSGIGACHAETDPAAAHRAWRQALDIFTRLNLPERFETQRRLDGGEYQLQAALGGGTIGT
jgi:DNA-binding SARP family transcriptional activator